MRYILLFLALITLPITTIAGGPEDKNQIFLIAMVSPEKEEQLKQTPTMSTLCIKKIKKNTAHVAKYATRIKKDNKLLDRIKHSHFKAELQNWVEYCTKPDEDDSE